MVDIKLAAGNFKAIIRVISNDHMLSLNIITISMHVVPQISGVRAGKHTIRILMPNICALPTVAATIACTSEDTIRFYIFQHFARGSKRENSVSVYGHGYAICRASVRLECPRLDDRASMKVYFFQNKEYYQKRNAATQIRPFPRGGEKWTTEGNFAALNNLKIYLKDRCSRCPPQWGKDVLLC